MAFHQSQVVAVLAVFTLAGVFLAGCTGEDVSEPPPRVSTTESEPVTDYTIPHRPQNVRKPEEPQLTAIDIDNAYELARYYLELYPYVKVTGDVTQWKLYAHPECGYCATVIDSTEEANEQGAWTQFNLGVVDEATFSSTGEIDFRVDFLVSRDEIIHFGPDGETRTPAGEHAVVVGLKETGSQLKVRSFDILQPDVFGVENPS